MPPVLAPGLYLPPEKRVHADQQQLFPPDVADGSEADGGRKRRPKKTSMQRVASRLRDMPAPKPSRKQVACMVQRINLSLMRCVFLASLTIFPQVYFDSYAKVPHVMAKREPQVYALQPEDIHGESWHV